MSSPPSCPPRAAMQPLPLHAPRPSLLAPPLSTLAALHYPESAPTHDSRSRLRGDGFLLDEDDGAEDAEDCSAQLTMQPPEPNSGGTDTNDPMSAPPPSDGVASLESVAPLPLGPHFMVELSSPTGLSALHQQMRPRSADVTGTAFAATKIARGASESAAADQGSAGIGGANPSALLCPSCGEQPPGAEHEGTFHAHITRCFITHHVGRPPRTPQTTPLSHHNGGGVDGGAGPIRKTRGRAASAAAATHGAAELASALASKENSAASMHTTPESHGYHPYSHSPHLSSTLTHLRRTVDQLDLHQRISIMEAFHKLSRVASAEQQQHASPMQPSPRGKRLRSATNSPSPKQLLSASDRVCKDILSLLYSPQQTIRAPHPSPMPNALFVGVPSPLVIGIASNAHAGAIKQQRSAEMEAAAAAASGRPPVPSIMHSPIAGDDEMRHLELEPTHAVRTPVKTSLLFSLNPPVPRRLDSASVDSSLSSPAMTDADGCESDAAAGSALAMTGAFVHGISSGASSPASTPSGPCSEQTSPSAPTESMSTASSAVHSTSSTLFVPHPRFPSHCFPASSVLRAPPPFPSSSASTSSSSSSASSSEVSPESPHPNMHGSAVLPLPESKQERASPVQCMHDEVTDKQQQTMVARRTAAAARG